MFLILALPDHTEGYMLVRNESKVPRGVTGGQGDASLGTMFLSLFILSLDKGN